MTRFALLGLLALAGCTRGPPPTPDQAYCAHQVYDDPTVKLMIIKGSGNPAYQREHEEDMQAAKQDAELRCLRARGYIPPGGVERQKPIGRS